jgi:hypothetical protein
VGSNVISIGHRANFSSITGFGVNTPGNIAIGANSLSDGERSIVIGNNSRAAYATFNGVIIGNDINITEQAFPSGGGSGFYTNAIRIGGQQLTNGNSILYYSTSNPAGQGEILRGGFNTESKTFITSVDFFSEETTDGTITYKTFVIDHPTKPDNHLVHASLEGPEAGVYYRGKAAVCDKFVEVELPNYVDALATNFTVHVTPIFDEDNIEENGTYKVTAVKNGKFKIYGPKGRVNWIVYGSRGDIEVEPKKSPVKLDEKIALVPATEAIPSPIPKKNITIKKRPKLILVESSDENKVVPGKTIDPNAGKIFNPLTNRHVKNTSVNRKKIEEQTLKRGGKSKKKTRKIKKNYL